MVLSFLTLLATDSVAESAAEPLPLGFLEYLGSMVEVESGEERTLLDPLDFEAALEDELPPEPTDASQRRAPSAAPTATGATEERSR